MKRIFNTIFVIVALTALSLSSCDKIEEGDYLVFAGATGQWYDGTPVADHSQRAFMEKYTGVRCINCPDADLAIDAAMEQYGNQLIAVAIHDSNSLQKPFPGNPDLRTPDGNAWSKYFGVYSSGSYPAGMVSRVTVGGAWDIFTPTSGINAKVDDILSSPAGIAVSVDAMRADGKINITANIEYLRDYTEPVTLTLLIMEDGIVSQQRSTDGDDPNYVHKHVLRDVITDLWGVDVVADGMSGTCRTALFVYGEALEEWNLDNCHIVALVSDKASKRVLNVAQCHVGN